MNHLITDKSDIDESTEKTHESEVQVTLIEADLLNEITDESTDKTDKSDTDESTDKTDESEVQVTLIELDLLNEIQIENTPQILTTEAPTEQTNRLIVTSEMNPDIGPIIQLNTLEDIPDQPIKITESTNEQNEEKTKNSDDPKNNAEIENVVKNLKAINGRSSSKDGRQEK